MFLVCGMFRGKGNEVVIGYFKFLLDNSYIGNPTFYVSRYCA